MINTDQQFLQQAIDLAQNNAASANGGPFGAVIVKDGEIIARASNSVTPDCDPTAHAEVNAIRAACKALRTFDLSGCVLYTSCEPCPMCLSASYWAHISRIVYGADRKDAAKAGFDDDFIYREIPLPIQERSIQMSRLLAAESFEPFAQWLANDKKIAY